MLWVLIVYGLVLMLIALLSLKYNKSFENFLVAGRQQPRVLIVASMLASTIGGGITMGTVGKAYAMGAAAFWFVAAGAIAHLIQGIYLSKPVRESEALTLPDLAGKLGGDAVRKLVAIIIVITWVGIAAGQFLAASKILGSISGMEHTAAVWVAAIFLLVYTLIGGQKSVLRTDLFQFGILAIAIIASVLYLYLAKTPAPGSVQIELFTKGFGPLDLAYYLVVVAGSYLICPMMFGRLLSADSSQNARKASFISSAGMFIFAVIVTAIGLWARATGFDAGGGDPFTAILQHALPKWLGILMLFGILAAILSTADTVLLTAAGIIENDILEKKSLLRVRLWIALIAVAGAIIALFNTDIIDLLLDTYQGYTSGIVPALFIAIVSIKKRRLNPRLLFAAILSGYILGSAGIFIPDAATQEILAFVGLALSAVLGLLAYAKGSPVSDSCAKAA